MMLWLTVAPFSTSLLGQILTPAWMIASCADHRAVADHRALEHHRSAP